MGQSIVEIVSQGLKAAGYRSQPAYPGKRIPALESTAVAVQLSKVDQKDATATVLVSVLTPVAMGGASCEASALEITRILRGIGGNCSQDKVEYSAEMEVFCIKIAVEFCGVHTENGWQASVTEQDFTVFLGETELPYVRSFQAFRDGLEDGSSVAGLPWRFRIEEVFPLNAVEPDQPVQEFDIVVIRQNRQETFHGCTLQYQERTIKSDAQYQIREGFCWSWTHT